MGFAEKKLAVVLGLLQAVFIVLFALFAEYHPAAHPSLDQPDSLHPTYAMFQVLIPEVAQKNRLDEFSDGSRTCT